MEFEMLKDFAKKINRNKLKSIEILGETVGKKSKSELLFEGLVFDKFKNEKEAVRNFFKTYDARHPGYLKIKNKLVRQLFNVSLFTDVNQPVFNERAKAYFIAYKDFAAAVILLSRNTSKPGIHLLQIVLDQAIKYEFTDLAADCSRMLRCEVARTNATFNKIMYYADLHRKYEEKRQYDMKALDYFETLVAYYATKRSPNPEIHRIATAFFDELYPLVGQVDTSFFYKCVYNIGIIKYNSINDSNSSLKICEEAFETLSNRKNVHRSTLVTIVMQKMALHTQLRTTDSKIIDELFIYCLAVTEEGHFNWFRICEVYFYYCVCSKQYQMAVEICDKILKNDNFKILDGVFHDNWLLLGGYLHLLARLRSLSQCQVEEIVGPFRYSKLFNEIEVLKKDKEGMNIPLILLPVLYELAQEPSKRTKEIHIEAMEKYRQRWVANDLNRRSNCFFKMVIAFAKGDFLCAATQRKINKEFELLKGETPEIARQNFAIEIIPYETLWELLMAKVYPRQAVNGANPVDITILPKRKPNSIRART